MTNIKYLSKIALKYLKSFSEHDKFACSISLCKPEGSVERFKSQVDIKSRKVCTPLYIITFKYLLHAEMRFFVLYFCLKHTAKLLILYQTVSRIPVTNSTNSRLGLKSAAIC